MAGQQLRLSTEDLWSALEYVDPFAAVTDHLAPGGVDGASLAALPPDQEEVVLDDHRDGSRCVLPAAPLRAAAAAGKAAFAAKHLLGDAVMTLAVLGTDPAAQFTLAVLARHLPSVSHAALCVTGDAAPVEPRVVDQLDLAGIGLATSGRPSDAVRGANLVVICGDAAPRLRVGHISTRCLLVNAAGQDLPDDLVDRVHAVYVDDASLMDDHRHRYFVKTHFAGSDADRQRSRLRSAGGLRGDFRALAGGEVRPSFADRVVLVELLDDLGVARALARRLALIAPRMNIGTPVADD